MEKLKLDKNSDQAWDEILPAEADFLQSSAWAGVQQDLGYELFRTESPCPVQGFWHEIPLFGRFLYLPRPVFFSASLTESFLKDTEKERALFVRVEPRLLIPSVNLPIVKIKPRQPEATLVLDISPSDDELLSGFHDKTRYNIRLAERKGVTVKEGKDLSVWKNLLAETAGREGFRPFPLRFYKALLDSPSCRQFIAFHPNGQSLASALVFVFRRTAYYLHGVSSRENRDFMGPYALHFSAIKSLRGEVDFYDWWGVAPPAVGENTQTFHGYSFLKDHPFAGFTRFKAGFGGRPVFYPPAFEWPVKKSMYQLLNFLKRLRKIF